MFAERYRAALICVACDIPASLKVGGFLSHGARLGCNKCKREFVGGCQDKEMSSLADFRPEEPRTDSNHREQVRLVKQARTKQDRSRLERESDVGYTELLRLPYYQPIHFFVIDPMHSLFLDATKHVFRTLWTDQQSNAAILSKSALQTIQARIDSVN